MNARSSAGTNDLLADGAVLVRDAEDVLDALGAARRGRSLRLEPAPMGNPTGPDR